MNKTDPVTLFVKWAEVKRVYDPGNLFRMNKNIVPA